MDQEIARAGLDEVSAARRKSAELRGYREIGSIVSAWGAVWLSGFAAQQFLSERAELVWAFGWLFALGWTFTRPKRASDNRSFASWLIAVSFVVFLLAIIRPDVRTASMVCAIVLTASYALLGVWLGRRFLVLAAVVLIFACIGWWLLPGWLSLCLAFGGGASLIVGGFWIRRP
ncbi:hypothetical protein GCM10023208_00030 [Erythrobacter westpacificensis]|uniref:Uncharacterized protein n=1 Tax=Erythrobacter westpacificensis TaxID=1055231 RepID=A0ABP9JVJ5_9SPHN